MTVHKVTYRSDSRTSDLLKDHKAKNSEEQSVSDLGLDWENRPKRFEEDTGIFVIYSAA